MTTNRQKISTKWQLELDALPTTPEFAKQRDRLREQIIKIKKLELQQKKTNRKNKEPKKQETKVVRNPGLPADFFEKKKQGEI